MAIPQHDETIGMRWPLASNERKQLLINILDGWASIKPKAAYAYEPISPEDFSKGFRRITWRQMANAVNGLAWWITVQLGRGSNFDTLLYLGPNDSRQFMIIFACIKAGYKCLFMSHRLQLPEKEALLRSTSCKAILSPDLLGFGIPSIIASYPLPVFQVPPVSTLLKEIFPAYPYTKTFEEAKNDPFVLLHTSGTASTPRSMMLTNDWVATFIQSLHAPPPPGMEVLECRLRGCRVFVMFTPFHGANLEMTVINALINDVTIILPPANAPVSIETLINGLKATEADICYVPPYFVQDIASNPEYVEIVASRSSSLVYGAGKVSEAHADIMTSRMEFWGRYGATEQGTTPILRPLGMWDHTVYNYMMPHPDAGWNFRPYVSDGGEMIYEAIIVRKADSHAQPVFSAFPHLQEFPTRDLFVAHPTIPGMYKWYGRADDTVSLSTAANVNPMLMETRISQHHMVSGVLMVGNGRPRPVLLIELYDKGIPSEDCAELIWEVVDLVNQEYFKDHRILRSHIVFTDERGMSRSDKGSIQRGKTVQMYASEMRAIYEPPEFLTGVEPSLRLEGLDGVRV